MTKQDKIKELVFQFNSESDGVDIYPTKYGPMLKGEKPITYGINWSAWGTVTAEKAKEFIKNLQKAIELVENINKQLKEG